MELFFLVTQQNNVGLMFGEKRPHSHLLNTQLMLYCTNLENFTYEDINRWTLEQKY